MKHWCSFYFMACICTWLLLLVSFNGFSQSKTITGKIINSSTNKPLSDASVLVKGTTKGTVSDANGTYSIVVPQESSTLIFSYTGMETQEWPVSNKTSINIDFKQLNSNLDEVVVVGYGTQKKVNLTGAVATLDKKALEARPLTNVSQGLQGLLPGLNITPGGGLDNKPSINIRGIATIGKGSSGNPLILIDGMEGDINAVNPNDVENVTVLKDAAASSIYGSRAPFGVILVTTKKGTVGKMQVSFNSSVRSNIPLLLPKQMDSYTFVNYINLASRNLGNGDFFSPAHVQRVLDFQQGKLGKSTITQKPNSNVWDDGYSFGNDNVDWYRAVYRTSAPSQEHSLNVSGGSGNITYYLSGDFLGQDGLMKLNQDTYKRYSLNAKINAKLSGWASISYNARFTREDFDRPSALTDNLFSNLGRQGWPTLPLYDPNGFLFSSPSPALALRDGGQDKAQTDWNYQQVNLTLEPVSGWKIFANINYKIGDVYRHWDVLPTYDHDVNGTPYFAAQGWYVSNNTQSHEQAERTNYVSPNIYSEYAKSIGKNNVKVMIGYQSELNNYRSLSATRIGIMVPSLPSIDITSGTDINGVTVPPTVGGNYKSWSTAGLFGRLNYDYDGRYLLEVNLRHDGTSRFQADQRWNYFPSASMGWNVSREEFWKPIKNIINTFKLRGSYGQLGNQNTDAWYPTYATMPVGIANGGWLINDAHPNTSSAPGLISSTLTWEKIKTYNVGVDLGFLKSKLTASFDYFVRYTNDMTGPAPELPVILGTGVPTTNDANLKTYGFELAIAWQDRLKNGLGYSIGFNLADSRAQITSYPNPTGNLGTYPNQTGKADTYNAGQMYGDIWGYTTIGIAKTQTEMDAHMASLKNGGQNAIGNNWKAGDIMYNDANGDGKIDNGSNTKGDHGDLSVIGNTTARYLFGLDLSADWKGFDVRAFLQGVLKRDFYQNSPYFFGASGEGVWGAVAFVQHEDYFRDDPNSKLGLNLNSYYSRPLLGDNKNIQNQTRYLQNAGYIRLKNLQLGYTIPAGISKNLFVKKCRVYVSCENLFTITKLAKMFDPETIDGGTNGRGGWGGNVYPLTKVYSVGASLTF